MKFKIVLFLLFLSLAGFFFFYIHTLNKKVYTPPKELLDIIHELSNNGSRNESPLYRYIKKTKIPMDTFNQFSSNGSGKFEGYSFDLYSIFLVNMNPHILLGLLYQKKSNQMKLNKYFFYPAPKNKLDSLGQLNYMLNQLNTQFTDQKKVDTN